MAQKPTPTTKAKPSNQSSRSGTIAGGQLRALIQRIERLEEEKAALAADIREVYAEAKGGGFDPKTMRQVVRLRKHEGNLGITEGCGRSLAVSSSFRSALRTSGGGLGWHQAL